MRVLMVVLVLAAITSATVAVGAESSGTAAPTVGVVEMEKVATEYIGMQVLTAQFEEFRMQQEGQLAQLQRTRMLSDAEQTEFLDLVKMGAPTPDREKRLAELEKLSKDREVRLLGLRQKAERTPEEEAEFQTVAQIYETRARELAMLSGEVQNALQTKYDELSAVYQDRLREAAKAVAEEQKLGMVLPKESVLYCGVDITDAVIVKLNAMKPVASTVESGAVEKPAEESKEPAK